MCVREKVFQDLVKYCNYYNLAPEHIIETLEALKVVPMVRGICFEFTVYDRLKEILPENKWKVEKPVINAQSEIQDIDVLVTHSSTRKKIFVECKLAGKNSFRVLRDNQARIRVKCMRSRAVGSKSAARALAERYGVSHEDVLRHGDNYRDVDFNFVVTSIGNAFWKTAEDGSYIFEPKSAEITFLRNFFNDRALNKDQMKEKTFNYLLIARSSHLKVSPQNGIQCRRRKCKEAGTSNSCGFIPNFPIVNLNNNSVWKPIEKAEEIFEEFVNEQK